MDEIWRCLYEEQKEYLSCDGFDPDEDLKMEIEKQMHAFVAHLDEKERRQLDELLAQKAILCSRREEYFFRRGFRYGFLFSLEMNH